MAQVWTPKMNMGKYTPIIFCYRILFYLVFPIYFGLPQCSDHVHSTPQCLPLCTNLSGLVHRLIRTHEVHFPQVECAHDL
jgi:hypothetical protein